MNVNEARELVKNTVSEAMTLVNEAGLISRGRTYFCDKNLTQITEFNTKAILLFGSIEIGTEDIESDEFCTYALCCEIKTGTVNEEELEREILDFKKDVQALIDEILTAPSKKGKILEINARQEKEAEKSFEDFNSQMKKMKLWLYGALGVLAIIALAVLAFNIFV